MIQTKNQFGNIALEIPFGQNVWNRDIQNIPSNSSRMNVFLKQNIKIDHMLGHKASFNKFNRREIISATHL